MTDTRDLATIAIAAGAGVLLGHLAHLLYGRRYKRALAGILAAADDPHNRHLGRALDDADELLGRRK
jgi:hypothetical protein